MIGFGRTEQLATAAIEELITNHIRLNFSGDYFTDIFIEDVKNWCNNQAILSRQISDGYKTAEKFPDRYSYFYSYVVGDCNYIAVILNFNHINRRHALSPDGWALLQQQYVFAVSAQDLRD